MFPQPLITPADNFVLSLPSKFQPRQIKTRRLDTLQVAKPTIYFIYNCKRTHGLATCYRWFDYLGTLFVGVETPTYKLLCLIILLQGICFAYDKQNDEYSCGVVSVYNLINDKCPDCKNNEIPELSL